MCYALLLESNRSTLVNLYRAKNVEEAAGNIRFCVFPQKTGENAEKRCFRENFPNFLKVSERIRTHPDASECIRTHPNASEQVRTGPIQEAQKLRNTYENLEQFANISEQKCEHVAKKSRTF